MVEDVLLLLIKCLVELGIVVDVIDLVGCCVVDYVVEVGCWVIVVLLDLFYLLLVVVSDGLVDCGEVVSVSGLLLDCLLLILLCEVLGFGNIDGMVVLVRLC